jgi:hypothetical protein
MSRIEISWRCCENAQAFAPSDDVWAVMQIKYSQDHQYIIVDDGVGTVGITNHAQEKLSDMTTAEAKVASFGHADGLPSPPCPDSAEFPRRNEMTRWATSRRPGQSPHKNA